MRQALRELWIVIQHEHANLGLRAARNIRGLSREPSQPEAPQRSAKHASARFKKRRTLRRCRINLDTHRAWNRHSESACFDCEKVLDACELSGAYAVGVRAGGRVAIAVDRKDSDPQRLVPLGCRRAVEPR